MPDKEGLTMEYCEIDQTTSQVLSAGSSIAMYNGRIVEVPELPQRKDPNINISDYYWDGTQFVFRPSGNIQIQLMKVRLLEAPIIKALIETIEVTFNKSTDSLKTAMASNLDTILRSK